MFLARMNRNLSAPVSRFDGLKRLFFALFGVNEVLFLAGFAAFFYGIAGLFSVFMACAVGGCVLMVIAVGGIIFAQRKTGE